MDVRVATIDGRKMLALFLILFACFALTITVNYYFTIGVFFLLLIILKQLIMRSLLRGPKNRSPQLNHPDYQFIKCNNDGIDVCGYVNYQPQEADLVVVIHGWMSSSSKFVERMRLFRERGFHTLAHDMRGHGIAPHTDEWTAGKVISDLKFLLENIEKNLVRKVHFYGHSLGGYICLGLYNKRHSGWWKQNTGTLILESPMTAYSPIMRQMSGILSFLAPLLRKWALASFRKIHPQYSDVIWADVDIPRWGLPDSEILLLQSANDSKLGRYHFDLLMRQNINVEAHLLTSLTHSKNQVNIERDQLIIKWIEEKMK